MDDLLIAVQNSKLRKGKSDKRVEGEVSAEEARQERLMLMAFRMGQSSSSLEAPSSRQTLPTQPVIPALGDAATPVQASHLFVTNLSEMRSRNYVKSLFLEKCI